MLMIVMFYDVGLGRDPCRGGVWIMISAKSLELKVWYSLHGLNIIEIVVELI